MDDESSKSSSQLYLLLFILGEVRFEVFSVVEFVPEEKTPEKIWGANFQNEKWMENDLLCLLSGKGYKVSVTAHLIISVAF